jgi:hypothetical protein
LNGSEEALPENMKRLSALFLVLFLALPALTFGQSSWNDMSRQEREALQKKYREWKRLPDSEKARVKKNYRRWQELPKYEKQELQKRWQFWQGLPKDRRDMLKQQFQQQFRRGK